MGPGTGGGGGGAGSSLGEAMSGSSGAARAVLRWRLITTTTTKLSTWPSSVVSSTFGSQLWLLAGVWGDAPGAIPDGGTVSFSTNGQTIAGCEAVQGYRWSGAHHGFCEASTLPTGSHSFVVAYSGDNSTGVVYQPSRSAPLALVVTKAASSVKVRCSPNPVGYPDRAQCEATVSGPATPPTGKVSWTTSGKGSFLSGGCTLSAGRCSVTYNPSAADVSSSGSVSIKASYAGDKNHTASAATTLLAVRAR